MLKPQLTVNEINLGPAPRADGPRFIEMDGVTYAVDYDNRSPHPIPGCKNATTEDGRLVALIPIERLATEEEAELVALRLELAAVTVQRDKLAAGARKVIDLCGGNWCSEGYFRDLHDALADITPPEA